MDRGMKPFSILGGWGHFVCKWCEHGWSIRNAPAVRHYWFCPWCGVRLTPSVSETNE